MTISYFNSMRKRQKIVDILLSIMVEGVGFTVSLVFDTYSSMLVKICKEHGAIVFLITYVHTNFIVKAILD